MAACHYVYNENYDSNVILQQAALERAKEQLLSY